MDESKGYHIIRFTASWCGPCNVYAPIFQAVLSSKPNVKVHVVDIDDDPLNLVGEYGVRSVPTTVLLRDGKVVDTLLGAVPASKLHELIDSHFSFKP